MSDFDTVLERLLTDPGFQAALSADPETALAGYVLTPEERDLLGAQVVQGSGGDRTVELRATKSSTVGLLGPVIGALLPGAPPATSLIGNAPPAEVPTHHFGVAEPTQVLGDADTPAEGYRPWVDIDGDGRGDDYQAYERGDGGVELRADHDGDGRVDFVARDYDRDGLVDDADYDTDGDGVLDERLRDTTGDGYLDTRG